MAVGSAALAWAVGLGTLAVAGVAVVLYEQSQSSTPTTAATGPNANPCQNANSLAALATTSSNPASELAAYTTWAAQCVASGGTPNPFPTTP